MMCSMKRALALLSFVMLVGVASGWAQGTASFLLTTTPTDVARTGRSEVLGQVQLTAPATCGTHLCGTSAGSIVITYLGVQLDNSTGSGISVCETVSATTTCSPTAGTYITGTVTVSNPPQGGTVSFGVKALTSGSTGLSAGDQVTIEGARGRIDLSSYNTPFGSAPSSSNDIPAELTASPSTIASATPVQQTVARAKDAMTIKVSAADILECIGTGTPTVTVNELFASAFVDQVAADQNSNSRPLFGGNTATEVNLVVTGLPSGVTLTWPTDSFGDLNTGSFLTLVSQTAKGDQATYIFTTENQAESDTFLENWQIGDGDQVGDSDSIQVGLSGTNADFGSAGIQAQLYPPALPSTNRPRYNDPLHPAPPDPFLQVGPCTTTILFPWMTNQFGFDTGMVLANTSRDITNDANAVIVSNPTPLEHGTCSIYGFPQGEGAELFKTTADVSAGDVATMVLGSDTVFRGFQGYIIARCNFQYGHGYAYVVNNNIGGEGSNYLGLIIPDPVVMGALGSIPSRSAGPFVPTSENEDDGTGTFVYSNTNSGEQLDN